MPTVETNGIEIYYEEYGEGVPVVCLHGANSDHQLFAEQFRPLAEEARVVVCDLRGHGRTQGSDHDAYSMALYAEDVAGLIDELGLENPVVCGLSLGGIVGYKLATTRPEPLSGLVTLGAPTPQAFSLGERLYQAMVLRIVTRVMGNERLMSGFNWMMEQIFCDSSTVEMNDVERIREAHSCENTETPSTDQAKIMRGAQNYYTGSSLHWESVDVPVLAMFGENEPFHEHHAKYVSRQVDEGRVEEVPGASHNSHVDNPEFIIERVRAFLDDVFDEQEEVAPE